MPEGVVFQGQKQLFFEGYKLDSQGQPTFMYRMGADKKKSVAIEEQPVPLRGAVAVGLARHMDVQNNAHSDLWLHVLSVPASTMRPLATKPDDFSIAVQMVLTSTGEFAICDLRFTRFWLPPGEVVSLLGAAGRNDQGREWTRMTDV